MFLITFFLFYVISFAQNSSGLFKDYKKECQKLDKLFSERKALKLSEIQDVNQIKYNIFRLEKELKKRKSSEGTNIYKIESKILDNNFELLDFYMYDWTTESYRVVARLRCKTKLYSDYVKLRHNFYKNNSLVGTDYTYIDYESYGSAGMLPYHTSFLETFTDKVDFDSIAFEISYSFYNSEDILWDQILELESNEIVEGTYINQWFGSVKNTSNYSVKYPKIFACFFKDENMIDLNYTYLDVENDSLPANTSGMFDSYIDLPEDYDEIKYYLNYSLNSLNGSGNITPNWPVFTQMSYSGSARTNISFDMFLIDHENDPIQVQVDWGDGSSLNWSNSFSSRTVSSITHTFTQAGTYSIKSKSKDVSSPESSWSDCLKVEILPVPELSIITEHLKSGTYHNIYRDTVKVEGGITPYFWNIHEGNLPGGLLLNQNSGLISGNPSASGTFDFSIIVTDGGTPSESDTAAFSITIVNNPPYFISSDSVSISEHDELFYTARALDPENNTINYSFENYPHWLTPSDSTISGTPPEGATDTSFVVIASDGELTDILFVHITIISPTIESFIYNFPKQGWYLISLPVNPPDSSLHVLFPDALAAFGYDSNTASYYVAEKLKPKRGYWLLIPSATSATISGTPLTNYTEHYPAGWHLIGSVNKTINFTDPDDNPSGAVIGAYGWDVNTSQYFQVYPPGAGVLEARQGYWLAAFQDCDLTIGGGTSASARASAKSDMEIFRKQFGSRPPLPPFMADEISAQLLITEMTAYNYPNPFNPETVIEYTLPKAGLTQIFIYNASGQRIRTILEKEQTHGIYRVVWDGRNDNGNLVSTGIYFYRIINSGAIETGKMLLLK